jgi:hypothetical protein
LNSNLGPTFFLLFTLWCFQLRTNALLLIFTIIFFFSSHYYSSLRFAMLPLLFTVLLSPFWVGILIFALLLFFPFHAIVFLSSLHCCYLIYNVNLLFATLLFSYLCSSTSFFMVVFLQPPIALLLQFVEGSCATPLHSLL